MSVARLYVIALLCLPCLAACDSSPDLEPNLEPKLEGVEGVYESHREPGASFIALYDENVDFIERQSAGCWNIETYVIISSAGVTHRYASTRDGDAVGSFSATGRQLAVSGVGYTITGMSRDEFVADAC